MNKYVVSLFVNRFNKSDDVHLEQCGKICLLILRLNCLNRGLL